MSENPKKILEKKGQDEYDFTPYGDFLSYFHSHIDIFKKILKIRKIDPIQIENTIKETKAYMTANIKKTDHFFEHLPQFSTLLGVPQPEISNFLNNNFLEVVGKVKEKLKRQELEKLKDGPDVGYEHITEEIIEKLKFVFPADSRFAERDILIVLENMKTGDLMEPQGLMAESARAALAVSQSPDEKSAPISLTEALTQANAPPPPVKKQSIISVIEISILKEIVDIFGETLTGESLPVEVGIPVDESSREDHSSEIETKKDSYEIEDLEFENESPDSKTESKEEAPDDLMDDFNVDLDSTPEANEPEIPYLEKTQKYSIKEFLDIGAVISGFQQKADQAGYQNWLGNQGEFEKTVISFRTNLLKEQKGEPIAWDTLYEGIVAKTQFQLQTLQLMQSKLKNFQMLKMTLDRTITELKKGTPEFLNMVRMAWPHIQKSFYDVPNYEQVQRSLKGILARISDEGHRKEFTRIFSMTLNFIQSKYKA